MRRVITVSLNGNAHQLEEDACALLDTYLEEAARVLAGDPDRQEIVADLEQAIADKCARFLGPHKNVLNRAEVEQVLGEMGPVDGTAGAHAQASATAGLAAPAADSAGEAAAAPRRLYQISEGAMISGVCNGLAAYFGVDVTIVRVVAVVLAFLSAGLAVLLYLVLMFIVPYASTSEEQAAARGLPFNARTLVERAKQKYQQFADGMRPPPGSAGRAEWKHWRREWRAGWRQARAEWRATRRQARWQRRYGEGPDSWPAAAPLHYGTFVLSRVVLAAVGLALALVSISWLLALLSFVTTGAFFGFVLPFHAPFWVVIVALFVVAGLVTGPLRAVRHAVAAPFRPHAPPAFAALDGLLTLAVIVALLVYASHHVPEIGNFVHRLAEALRDAVRGPGPGASA